MYDIIIIGSGPAGLTSAIYARRANKSVLVIEKAYVGGQVATLGNLYNYPAFAEIDGFTLSQNMYSQAKSLGAEFVMQEVVNCDLLGDIKKVTTYKDTYEAKAVIIATGAYSKPLKLENEKNYIGNGLSYCATCDGNFFKGKKVAIISSGESGIDDCVYLGNLASDLFVVFTHDAPKFDTSSLSAKVNILDNSKITEISGEPVLSKITVQNKKTNTNQTLEIDGLFVALGKKPFTDCFTGLKLNDGGYIVTDQNMRTNIKNVYAVGDVRNTPLKQIVTACSDGAVAVSTIISDKL